MNLKKIGLFALAMIMTLFSFQSHSLAAEKVDWVKKSPMPTARYNIGGIVYDNKIYVYGGTPGMSSLANLEVYDPAKDEWEVLPSSSHARGTMAFVENKGKFYAIGGATNSGPTNIVEMFDPVSNNWTSAQSMPKSLRFINAVSLDNTIYTFGGIENGNESTNLVYSFNTQTGSWTLKNPMPEKEYLKAFIANDSIYAVFSKDDKNIIYHYNHVEDTWTKIDEIPSELGVVIGALNFNGKIIFVTPFTLSSYDVNNKLVTYSVPPFDRSGGTYGIVNDKLYMIGGRAPSTTSEVVELNLSDLINPDPDPNPEPKPDPNPEPKPEPTPNTTGNALLVIYMDSGLIKEFEMTNEEIRNFTEWYEGRAKGNGREAYIVNKKYNIGPFNSRKDFISYSHIESFEVQEYSR